MECNYSHGEKDRCKSGGTMNRANWPKTYFKLCRAPIKSMTLVLKKWRIEVKMKLTGQSEQKNETLPHYVMPTL